MARSYKRKKTKGLTGRGRLAIVFASLVVLSGLYFAFQDQIKNAIANSNSGESIKIGVVTWPGYAAGQYMNDGFEANTECRFYEEYGIQVEFMVLDDFVASRKAFENGDVDLLWVTVDALPTEMGQNGTMVMGSPKFIFQADWSRGGDAVVARRGIDKVSDLKGKTVAVAQGTPSHSFLIELLKTNSMTMDDIKVQFVADAIRAAELFKQDGVDAAVVWSPDDIDCVNKVNGSKILSSTKTATHIIADGFIAKQEYIDANREKLQKLYEGWMVGASELNTNKNGARQKAAKILADKFQMKESDALASMDNVRYATHGDNLDFFGLGDSKAVTGDGLYSKMAGVYTKMSFVDNPLSWRDASDISIIKSTTLNGDDHKSEARKKFEVIKDEKIETLESFSSKKITINFATNKSELSGDDKHIIDKEFGDIANTYQGARIRIEGNTDNTGNYNHNVNLSKQRAQAVKDYLVKEHSIDPNRIVIIGNGPKHAVEDNIVGANEAYRNTDFQLLSE